MKNIKWLLRHLAASLVVTVFLFLAVRAAWDALTYDSDLWLVAVVLAGIGLFLFAVLISKS